MSYWKRQAAEYKNIANAYRITAERAMRSKDRIHDVYAQCDDELSAAVKQLKLVTEMNERLVEENKRLTRRGDSLYKQLSSLWDTCGRLRKENAALKEQLSQVEAVLTSE